MVVWTGVALMLAGAIGTGFGLARNNAFWLLWVSVGAIVVGFVLMWAGGAMYDVHGASKAADVEIVDVAKGRTHTGVAPTDRLVQDEVRRRAVEANRRTRELIAERTGGPAAPLFPIGSLFLLIAGVWLIIGEFALPYSHSNPGYNGALRDMAFGVVIALSALWMRHVGPSRVASLLCLLSGALLLGLAFALPHNSGYIVTDEVFAGTWVLLATAATFEGTQQEVHR